MVGRRSRKFANPILFLSDLHDFFRALYYLKKGLTKYQYAKLMMISDTEASRRLDGLVEQGMVRRGEDGKYYLAGRRYVIHGFGEIVVSDEGINIYIDPASKFSRLKYSDRVEVEIYD